MQNIQRLKIKQAESWAKYGEAKKTGKTGRSLGAFKGGTTRRGRAVSQGIKKQQEEARTKKESARIEKIRKEAKRGGHWFNFENLKPCTGALFKAQETKAEAEQLAAILEKLGQLVKGWARFQTIEKTRETVEKVRAKLGEDETTRARLTIEKMQKLAAIFENLGEGGNNCRDWVNIEADTLRIWGRL